VTGRSLVQRDPSKFGVSECNREVSIMKRPWATRSSRTTNYKYILEVLFCNANPNITVECPALVLHIPKFSILILDLDQALIT
jgi:hypothetical protein